MEKNKKIERQQKYKEISVQSAEKTSIKHGWLTKRGGRKVNWRRRYCVLSNQGNLYYFKNQKAKMPQGAIELHSSSQTQDLNIATPKKAVNCSFQIYTPKRTFFIFADSPEEKKLWMEAITKGINGLKGGTPAGGGESSTSSTKTGESAGTGNAGAGSAGTGNSGAASPTTGEANTAATANGTADKMGGNSGAGANAGNGGGGAVGTAAGGGSGMVKGTSIDKLRAAREAIPWMRKDEKVGEFWQIWLESMPPSSEDIEFEVSTSLTMEKLGWRSSGAQNVFIQRMVDFFFDVGASESEIDRLNTLGALMEPNKIGPWIEMSDKQGMDGGWFFPVIISIDKAVQAMDPGPALDKVKDWVGRNKIEQCCTVGRDMGAMPPRQATLRVLLPGTIAQQMEIAMDAFKSFGVPPIPENVLSVIHEQAPQNVTLSIITCPDGFVQLGIWVPNTPRNILMKLCDVLKVDKIGELEALERALGKEGTTYCEYKHLMSGFGYGAYKEGFDVMLHYTV